MRCSQDGEAVGCNPTITQVRVLSAHPRRDRIMVLQRSAKASSLIRHAGSNPAPSAIRKGVQK
jgi:hypothetical protein